MLRWPDTVTVRAAALQWAEAQRAIWPDLVRLGLFGSYARGDAGVGSDLDLVVVVRDAGQPFERRAAAWDVTTLPVPAEILVYTSAEWQALAARQSRFARMLAEETVWLIGGDQT